MAALSSLNATSVNAIRENLRAAAADDRVQGLIVHTANCPETSFATLDEIGDEIEEFSKHKSSIAWAESFGELTNELGLFTLATAAREIWLQPTGGLGIGGIEANIVLFKGMLNKANIDPQFHQRYQYKTAGDQFGADHVTDANREMTTRMAQSFVEEAVATIARRRGLEIAAVWDAVNNSPLTAQEAKDAGLVDHLGYRDQAYSSTLDQWSAVGEHLQFVNRYQVRFQANKVLKRNTAKVAVVKLRGAIVTGRGGNSPIGGPSAGSDVVDAQLRAVSRDENVKAVIFDVDSPGGSAVASDFIRRSVIQLKESGRPVVARMGGVAASGGYYVSMACNEIVAQPSTLTGSIGVVAGKFVTQGLYERLGLVREQIRIGAMAGTMSTGSQFNDAELAKLDAWLDRIYQEFTSFAAEDRGMEYGELESLAKGRVWTGADAKRNGLIDHLGGVSLAFERACELADLDPKSAQLAHIRGSWISELMPAENTNSTKAGISLPSGAEGWLQAAANEMGVAVPGALSLPFKFKLG